MTKSWQAPHGRQVPNSTERSSQHKSPRKSVKRKLYHNTRDSNEKSSDNQNSDNNDKPPPNKKEQRKSFHGGNACKPCAVWISLGGDPNLDHHHRMDKIYHPQDRADAFSQYLSCNGVEILLISNSCLCNSCYKDCMKNAADNKVQPRWVKLHTSGTFPSQKHCAVCHYDGLLFNPGDKTP